MARTTDDFEYTHRPSYQNITGAGSTGFEPWKNIGRPMTAPDTWDPFGNYDPYGGGLYRMSSQRDPGILADLQKEVEENQLSTMLRGLMGRGEGLGDMPSLDTGYKIDINVLGDLVRGLTGNRGMGQGATQTPTVAKAPPEEAKKKEVEFDPNLRAGGGSALFLEQLPQKTAEKADIDPAQRYVDPTKLFLEELRQGLSQLAQNTPRVAFRNNQWIDNMTGDEVDIIDAQTGRSIV